MIVYVKLLLTAVFWGGTFIAGRVVSRNIDPYSAAFLRFFIASFFLFLFIWLFEGSFPPLKRKQVIPVICLGMTGIFIYNILFFSGLRTVAAGRASLIIALNPIVISLLSAILFKEKLTVLKLVGICVSVCGAMIVISHGELQAVLDNPFTVGDLFIFGCVASWVAYSLIGKLVLEGLSPMVSVGYSSMIGTVALFVPAVAHGMFQKIPTFSVAEWSSLFYLGFFGTVLGFFWYYQGIKRIGPMKTSVFINFVPVSAIALAYFFLNEPVTLSLITGAMLVICGVLLTNFSHIARRRLNVVRS